MDVLTSAKRGPSSPKLIVESGKCLTKPGATNGKNDSSEHQIIRPTPVKLTPITEQQKPLDTTNINIKSNTDPKRSNSTSGEASIKMTQTAQDRPKSHSPVVVTSGSRTRTPLKHSSDEMLPERDTNNTKSGLVTNVVVGGGHDDSGYQILSSRDEEAEREHPLQRQTGVAGKTKYTITSSGVIGKPKRIGGGAKGRSVPRHDHHKDELTQSLEKAHHLLDVKAAIERLRLRNDATSTTEDATSTASSATSTASSSTESCSGSDSELGAAVKKVKPTSHSSQNAVGSSGHHPQVTSSADEFVWIDSYNRLVELQKLPWNHTDLCKAICQRTSMQEHEIIGVDLLSRLSYYLQRALVRISREAQRLSRTVGKCGKQEVSSALKIVLSPTSATAAVKACLRAAAMFSISSDDTRQTKSSRAGLLLHVGKMHRWMCLVKVGRFVHELSAIFMTAGIETILEDLIAKSLEAGGGSSVKISACLLEQTVAGNSDYWGLFQPYSHLSSCRTANGLDMPRALLEHGGCSDVSAVRRVHGGNQAAAGSGRNLGLGQALLTTCVGSVEELEEIIMLIGPVLRKTWQSVGTGASHSSSSLSSSSAYRPSSQASGIFGVRPTLTWNAEAMRTLYHFVRCSQLEYVGQEGRLPIQELIYERPYMVLPPMVEWARVSTAFAEHRNCCSVDCDDVLQAARILLPGMDYPVRSLDTSPWTLSSMAPSTSNGAIMDELEYVNHLKREMALHMLQTGRRDLVPHALQMLPSAEKVNATNAAGLTPLQLASLKGDTNVTRLLLDTGADVDGYGGENKFWTALCYAVLGGHYRTAKLLLDRGAHVEGGALLNRNEHEHNATETPLQLASGSGSVRMVELLLSSGASPFLSTTDGYSGFSAASQTGGCYSAVAVAATHGHKKILSLLVSHALTASPHDSSFGAGGVCSPSSSAKDQVMSLEEILAEGATDQFSSEEKANSSKSQREQQPSNRLGKSQVRKLQESMYHASEATNLELTLDLRNLGVAWTMHTWLQTLQTANETQLVSVINELLQDFSTVWPKENSSYFVDVGLPLLLSIFRSCKSEGTILLLADILCACYGRSKIETIEPPKMGELGQTAQPRIDPKFVNNPELSDVSFRVEGRLFYAHKLVLVTASSRFQSMLNSRFCEGSPPVLQINDIRYDIFQLVMSYLYNGGSHSLQVEASDVLELMAAANFFQLPGLLRYCEYRCSHLVDLDNIVSYYIHAKVYSAIHLLAYCEGFLLQNMVALLTYDDSVKRLLFGKKLQNHDVLSGLLATLQSRLRAKQHKPV